ncbi:MAG: carboxypeptidase regulatory-like domain-containing protein, partial [Thaumarchaeota archaeon]|nr:carboxypeptidase regulatory-like domain-containing protein [Nitrososphaerota archaeon]
VNLEGEPVPNLKVKLSSEGYSAESEASNGTALFKNLPSSSLEGVGAYEINVSMRTAGGYMPIYSEERAFESSQSLSLIADLAKLSIRVVDREDNPVRGVRVLLSNELIGNFTLGATDKNGIAAFNNVLLSKGKVSAGAYSAMVFRAGKLIGEKRFEVMKAEETVKLVVERGEVRMRILDYRGSPLSGYQITLVDQLSGEKYNAMTDERGEAVFRIFYGPYDLEVYKDGRLIHSSQVRLSEESAELKLKEVNFPITIQVIDVLGAPISSAHIKLYAGDELLLEKTLNGEPITLNLPQPAELRCDIYSDAGQLIHRESIYADEPSNHVIELKDYIYLNGLIRLEPIASGIALTLFAASLLFSAILIRRVRGKG